MTAAFLALWVWGLVAGTLAVTVSAPWLIAAWGHGSYRFLPQLASAISSGRQILVLTALVAAGVRCSQRGSPTRGPSRRHRSPCRRAPPAWPPPSGPR